MSVILDLPFAYSVWISAAVAIVYTLFGGLYAVAYTDVLQLLLTFVCLVSYKKIQAFTALSVIFFNAPSLFISYFLQWLCVPFVLNSSATVDITRTALNHTFQEPWIGKLDQANMWKWIDDFLMIVS